MKNPFNRGRYWKNLSKLRRAGIRPKQANSMAKKLTDAQKQEEKDKFREEVEDELKKYGIIC
ncbi:hypothetical protein HYY72_04340 [Candidatus Woesearchaeota archaeon]|nr:hypothetical protein [Candidatus Woesearchaeota archaeon]